MVLRGIYLQKQDKVIFVTTVDSMYYFHLSIMSEQGDFNATAHIEMKAPYGYLSGTDYPLLTVSIYIVHLTFNLQNSALFSLRQFYGTMCLVYLAFGIIWLVVSFMQWRDLLRIQFWIGGVILLGMLEKAVFYAEYQTINSVGVSVHGAVLLAEWVSCAKRTLARMLVIIVSLGFGIVKLVVHHEKKKYKILTQIQFICLRIVQTPPWTDAAPSRWHRCFVLCAGRRRKLFACYAK